jgi:hypothetical protein
MRTDWSKRRDPEAYQNFDETGQHTPGPSAEAVVFLVEQRDVSDSARRRSAPTQARLSPAPAPTHATTSCTARAATGCSASATLDLLPPAGAS